MTVAVPTGIHRVELDSGYVVGSVNAWLVEGDPLTLVDAGTMLPGAMTRLEDVCASIGTRVADIEQIVLSHHHVDHVGLVAQVVERSGAPVVALAAVDPYVRDFEAEMLRDGEFARVLLERHGFEEDIATEARARFAVESRWASDARVDRRLAAGDAVEIGSGTYTVLYRPGHSETDTVFVDADQGLVLSGDHLLRDHASMPMLDRPLGLAAGFEEAAGRCDRLVQYRGSLRASLDDLDGVVLPGHGDAFDRPREVIARHLAHQDAQAEQVAGLLDAAEPRTGCQLAERLWPRTALRWAFLSACTVLGVLGRLEHEGRAVREPLPNGAIGYRSA